MVEVLDAGAVSPDVVRTPPATEFLAARGQFTDKVVEGRVVRVAPRFGTQDGHAVSAAVSQWGRIGAILVEEGVPGEVRDRAGLAVVQRRMHAAAKVIDGQQVHPAVADDGRRLEPSSAHCRRVEESSAARAPSWPHPGAGAVGGVGEVEEVGALGVVELQCSGERVEHRCRNPAEPSRAPAWRSTRC